MKPKKTTIITHTEKQYEITIDVIREFIGAGPDDDVRAYMMVPGGGDWSNTALDLEYDQVLHVVSQSRVEKGD